MCIGWKIINFETEFFFSFGKDIISISNSAARLFDEGHFAPECFIPKCWALYSSIREACFILLFELIKRSLLLVYNLYSTIDAQVRAFYISKGSICCSFCGFFIHGILLPLPPAMFLSKSVAWTLSFLLILCIINNLAFLASRSLNCIYFSL